MIIILMMMMMIMIMPTGQMACSSPATVNPASVIAVRNLPGLKFAFIVVVVVVFGILFIVIIVITIGVRIVITKTMISS